MNHTQPLVSAIQAKSSVTFNYADKPRTVEVHAIGRTPNGLAFRGFQIGTGWRLFMVDKVEDLLIGMPDTSLAPRDGYKMGDKHMVEILAEVQV